MLDVEPLKADDVAELLHIGKNAVYALAKSGELASYKIGRKILFSYADVEAYSQKLRRGALVDADESFPAAAAKQFASSDFVLAGDDIAGDIVASMLCQADYSTRSVHADGYDALIDLYRGNVDIACVHLYDMRTNSYNVPYVQRLAPGIPLRVYRLIRRRQGFVVAKDNPKLITTWGGLLKEGVRIANQQHGASARILLDEKLISLEANHSLVTGYETEYSSEYSAAGAVASGEADVAIANEQAAGGYRNVEFIPLQTEWVDLVVRKGSDRRAFVRQVSTIVSASTFEGMLDGSGDVDTSQLGAIIYEC